MGYRPRIKRASGTYDLPLPLMSMNQRHAKRMRTTVVPKQPGKLIASQTRDAITLSFSGIIVIDNPQDADRSLGKVTSLQAEAELLARHLIETDEPFTFFRFIAGATIAGTEINASAGTRFFINCVCQDLTVDWTNRSIASVPYSFSVTVPNGIEYYNTS